MSGGDAERPGNRAAEFVINAARLAFIATAVAVTVLCVLSAEALPPVPLRDKLEHFLAYGVLAAAGCIGYPGRRAQLKVVLFLLALGVGIEFAQAFVPGRSPSVMDMVANAIGVTIGTSVAAVLSAFVLRPRTVTA